MIDDDYIPYIYSDPIYSFEVEPKEQAASPALATQEAMAVPVIERETVALPTLPDLVVEESTKKIEQPNYKFLVLTTSAAKEEVELLAKIMQAIQIKREEYHIHEVSYSKIEPIQKIEEQYIFRYLICFGLSHQMISNPSPVGKYKLTAQSNYQILFSDTLSDLELNKQLKKLLWEEIKGLGV